MNMQKIVLITRENNERVTHVSVVLYNDYHEAVKLCRLVNRFFIAGEEKLTARCIFIGKEYTLEKGSGFTFDDMVKLDDKIIQMIMRDVGYSTLAAALRGSSEAIKEHFFRNMSKRAACMLQEDLEYMEPVFESEVDEAKQCILAVYEDVLHEAEIPREFQSVFDKYAEEATKKQHETGSQNNYQGEKYIALVLRGKKEIADAVSAAAFDSMDTRTNFCEFVNKLKSSGGSFIFAREAAQMVEYETTKPVLIRFDNLARWDGFITGTALRKVDCDTIASALRGLDEEFRETIIGNLPHRMADTVINLINMDEKSKAPHHNWNTKQARQKIVNAISAVEKQFKKGKYPIGVEFLKD
jgi:flagellar motor switch protein FliG